MSEPDSIYITSRPAPLAEFEVIESAKLAALRAHLGQALAERDALWQQLVDRQSGPDASALLPRRFELPEQPSEL